jgi:hypothetical protein
MGLCAATASVFALHLVNWYLGAALSYAADLMLVALVGAVSVAELFVVGCALVQIGQRTLRVPADRMCVASGMAAAVMLFAPIILDQAISNQTVVTQGGDSASSGWGVVAGMVLAFTIHPLAVVWMMLDSRKDKIGA